MRIYLDGKLIQYVIMFVGTNLNHISKIDTYDIESSNIVIDEIKIYDRVLDDIQIVNDSQDRTLSIASSTTNIITTTYINHNNTSKFLNFLK